MFTHELQDQHRVGSEGSPAQASWEAEDVAEAAGAPGCGAWGAGDIPPYVVVAARIRRRGPPRRAGARATLGHGTPSNDRSRELVTIRARMAWGRLVGARCETLLLNDLLREGNSASRESLPKK